MGSNPAGRPRRDCAPPRELLHESPDAHAETGQRRQAFREAGKLAHIGKLVEQEQHFGFNFIAYRCRQRVGAEPDQGAIAPP